MRLSITLLSASIGAASKRNLLDWTLTDSEEPGAEVRVTWLRARRRTPRRVAGAGKPPTLLRVLVRAAPMEERGEDRYSA